MSTINLQVLLSCLGILLTLVSLVMPGGMGRMAVSGMAVGLALAGLILLIVRSTVGVTA